MLPDDLLGDQVVCVKSTLDKYDQTYQTGSGQPLGGRGCLVAINLHFWDLCGGFDFVDGRKKRLHLDEIFWLIKH